MNYRLCHDHNKPIVLVGSSVYHENLLRDLSRITTTYQYSMEDILQKSIQWMTDHQFFMACSNVAWKKKVVESLSEYSVDWITVINENSEIDESCQLGRGVWINNHNVLMDNCNIGDHVVITNQCLLAHKVTVGDFSHLSPRCYLNWCDIGRYNCLASNCTVLGENSIVKISTSDCCNFIFNSIVTKTLTSPGTYYSKKMIDKRNSLEYKFF